MSKFSRMLTLVIFIGLLTGCTRPVPRNVTSPGTSSDATINTLGSVTDDIQFNLDAQPLDPVRKAVGFEYGITNNGEKSYAGPIEVTHDTTQINCPAINQVGNKDDKFDKNESMRCEGVYNLTQADFDAGGVLSHAQVSLEAGAFLSRELVTELPLTQNRELILKTITDPSSYDQVGQTITLTYEIMNIGTVTLGPAQFTIDEALLNAPLNCGPAASSLLPTESILCTGTYTVTQADLDSGSLTSNATATDGTTTSVATMVTVTKSSGSQPNPSGLTPGATIQHTVIPGDWLMQIARCYGADYENVRRANPHIYTPSLIWSGQTVSVPNIGSVGPIYDKPCVVFHTAVAGDTWESLAQQYNARVDILKRVNPGGLFVGANIKVPINSAGGSSSQVPGTKRIDIPFGATSATDTGTLTANGKVTYLVAASQGQTMTVMLTAPAGQIAMGIYDPIGAMLLNPANLALTWNDKLTADGDYRIELASAAGITDKNYSLKVELTTPVAFWERAADIWDGPEGSNLWFMTEYNGVLYLSADDGITGRELWKYDGANDPSLVKDILSGPVGSDPFDLVVYNGALYFSADDGIAGRELWKYDGTNPPSLAVDILKGSRSSYPEHLAVYNGALYFGADDDDHAGQVWKFDGTNFSITPIVGFHPHYLIVYDDALYYAAMANFFDDIGTELQKYDGTSSTLVADIWLGPESSDPSYLAVYNGALYFGADSGDGNGRELWRYDGANPPSLVKDIRSGPESSDPSSLAVYNGALYFGADSGDGNGRELWKYDGTNPPSLAADIREGAEGSDPSSLAVYNGALYFAADGGDGAGDELWRYISP